MIHFAYLKILIDIIEIFYKEIISVIEHEKKEQRVLEIFEKVFLLERNQPVEDEHQAHKEHFLYQDINDKTCSSLEKKIQQYQKDNHIGDTYVVSVIPSREFPCIHIVFPHEDKYFSIVLSIEKEHDNYYIALSTSNKENIYMIDFSDNLSKYISNQLQESTQDYSSISASEIIGDLMDIIK